MKVKLARKAGFCMGVRRAMEIVLEEANKGEGPLFTFGPLIHNNQVLDLLTSKGVRAVNNIKGLKSGRIVIRAHGIPPQLRQEIKNSGLKIIDATCPRVSRVQAIIRSHTRNGGSAIIVGDKDHAEVVGLMGHSETPAHIIQDPKDVAHLPHLKKPFVVAQTTQNEKNYLQVVNALKKRFPNIMVFDTICEATHIRQEEVRSFRDHVDAVVVVGGYHSGNSQRLAQVSKEMGIPTFHVETEKDLDKKKLSSMKAIGITAGASTPHWIFKNVVKEIEGIRGRREIFFGRWLRKLFKFLVLSNLAVAIGAFFFAHAASLLAGRSPDIVFASLAFLYIYAMHVLNRFLDKGASAYNDPERASFLTKHRRPFIFSGIIAIMMALALSFRIGLITFLTLGALCLMGIIYSIPLIPERMQGRYSISKIKDIPGSRSLSESLAWVAVISILPLLEADLIVWPRVIMASFIVFAMSYARSILFSIFQTQGDLIVGTETLPITLGEKKALGLLKGVLLAVGILLIAGPIFGIVGSYSFMMLLPLLGLSACLLAYEKLWLYPDISLEALVEGNFILAGLLAMLWQII